MKINRFLLGGLALSLFAHVSAATLLGHFGSHFDEEHSVIEVEILLEGNSNEIIAQSLPTSPKKKAKPAPQIETSPADDDVALKAPVETEPTQTSDTENFLNSSLNAQAQGRALDASEKYAMELRNILSQNVVYPSMAKRLRQKGRVVVRFKLRRDGQLIKAEVIESSKFALLNQAAQELIRKIDKMKPFPEELKSVAVQDFSIPIDYTF